MRYLVNNGFFHPSLFGCGDKVAEKLAEPDDMNQLMGKDINAKRK
jgi:hypothetical protein